MIIINKNYKFPDIYYSKEYGKLHNNKWECSHNINSTIIYVYYKIKHDNGYKLITPYGYAGYYLDKSVTKEKLEMFYKEFQLVKDERNYIDEEVRLNPYLITHIFFKDIYKLEYKRDTYGIDCRGLTQEKYLKDVGGNIRNLIKRGFRENLSFNLKLFELEDIDIFRSHYNKSMNDKNTNDFYKFEKEYYIQLVNMKSTYFISIKYNESFCSLSLFLFYDQFLHYHLSCRGDKPLNYAPNFMFYNIIGFALKNNIKLIHLGGGVTENDSLEKFKKKISNTHFEYYTAYSK